MRNFREAVIQILNIRKPVKIIFRFLKKDRAAQYVAMLNEDGTVAEHVIHINQGNRGRATKTLIAHELIHAWQAENGMMDEIHGIGFQIVAIALTLELELRGLKFKGPIFDESVDI